MSDRQSRKETYFHIWATFQMTRVLAESCGPRELALLPGKLPPGKHRVSWQSLQVHCELQSEVRTEPK